MGGNCELDSEATLEEQIPYLEACKINAETNGGRGWLMGYGFSLESTLDSDSEYTPLEIIDSIFPDRPWYLWNEPLHSMWVNSESLKNSQNQRQSPDPQGGAYLKDQDGSKLNGILLDNAGDQIMEMAWNSQSELFEQSYQGLMFGLEEAAAHGITTIGDGRMLVETRLVWRLVRSGAKPRFDGSRFITPLGLPINGDTLAIRSLRRCIQMIKAVCCSSIR